MDRPDPGSVRPGAPARRAALRRMLRAAAVVPLGGFGGLAGCVAPLPLDGPAYAELPPPVPAWITVRATEADAGRRFELPVGASIAVSLRVPALSGTGWVVRSHPRGLTMTGRTSGPVWPAEAPTSPVRPPPLWQVFVFEAREPGEGDVDFEMAGTDGRPPRLRIRVAVPGG